MRQICEETMVFAIVSFNFYDAVFANAAGSLLHFALDWAASGEIFPKFSDAQVFRPDAAYFESDFYTLAGGGRIGSIYGARPEIAYYNFFSLVNIAVILDIRHFNSHFINSVGCTVSDCEF